MTSLSRSAAFVRGFFHHLEAIGVRAAVLHGGEDGFEHEISDVDFVVDHANFKTLPRWIDDYCSRSGWLLCQVLRHETTAAYFVCCAADAPDCAVALDACSDYQRNGTVYLPAGCLLENRRLMPWGGHGISLENQLRYRFTKAALKNKDATSSANEFGEYPEATRLECQDWLSSRWKIAIREWDAAALTAAFIRLRSKSNSRPSLRQPGSFARILSRILHPAGFIVVTGREDFESVSSRLQKVYGHIFFRKFLKSEKWHLSMFGDLVTSSLIVIPRLTFPWSLLIRSDYLHRMNESEKISEIAALLNRRCSQREHQ